MHLGRLIFAILLLWAVLVQLSAATRLLVVLESHELKSTHSQFFEGLKRLGLELTYKLSTDRVKLREWDEWLYDHMLIFAPNAKAFGDGVGVRDVLDFIDSGHDIVVAAGPNLSSKVSELASECGVDFDMSGTMVYDHLSFAEGVSGLTSAEHTLVASTYAIDSKVITSQQADSGGLKTPVLFRGVAQTVSRDAELITVALTASPSAYSHGPSVTMTGPPQLIAGRDVALVTLLQGRNNARAAFFGSIDMFSDEFFNSPFKVWSTGRLYKSSGNREFCLDIAKWTFQQSGVLKASEPRHWDAKTLARPAMYKIKSDIHFEIDVSEYKDGKWVPFCSDDIQLEYVMLDPYVRKTMSHDNNGTFFVDFKAPDVYGVFKFVIDYRGTGYSYLQISEQAPLRPFRHDEYDRFLLSAYPYYTSCFSVMIGFFILGFFFLYHK